MSSTAYMCKNRHGTYYARFIIPKHLQPHFDNKKEIRRSLQTDSRKLAVKRARAYRVEFESIVDKLMSESKTNEYSAYQVILEGVTAATLPNGDKKPVTSKSERNITEAEAKAILLDPKKHIEATALTKKYFAEGLNGQAERLERQASEQATSERREKRADELHQAQLAAIAAATSQTQAPTQPTNTKKLSAYLDDYVKFQTMVGTRDGWNSPTTITKKTGMLQAFVEVCDKPAAAFNWDDAKRYIKIAQTIPPNFRNESHAKKFGELTLEVFLDDTIDTSRFESRKSTSISMDLKTARAFLEWIRAEERVNELQDAIQAFDNATKRISMESDRRAFTPEELKILFEDDNPAAENYVKGFNSKRSVDANLKYWLPLLGLYTGAAISELCQLHLSDIRKHKARDGSEHWVIDFNEHVDDDDSRFKTDYRQRLIPVHKVLLDLGFTDYVQTRLTNGEFELFPSAKRNIGKHGPESFITEGQWFGEYSDNAGVTDKNVVFHSFKHTQDTWLSNNHCDRDMVAAFSGHSIGTMGKTTYRTGGHRDADIFPLVEWSNKIDYGLKHHPFKAA